MSPLWRHCYYKGCFTLSPLGWPPPPPWPGTSFPFGCPLRSLHHVAFLICAGQAITSAGFHIAQVIQLFSSWRSRRILPTNSYSCLSLLLVSHKKCRMNLIGLWNLGAFLRDQSDSSYIAYVRQVARTNKNMSLLSEFSWILRMKTAETLHCESRLNLAGMLSQHSWQESVDYVINFLF